MKKFAATILVLLSIGFVQQAFGAEATMTMDNAPRMSVEQLKARLSEPDLAIIDVRAMHDWADSTVKIKGAVREDPYRVGKWIDKYMAKKTVVFYCNCVRDTTSATMVIQFAAKGHKNAFALGRGTPSRAWEDWETAKYPVEKK